MIYIYIYPLLQVGSGSGEKSTGSGRPIITGSSPLSFSARLPIDNFFLSNKILVIRPNRISGTYPVKGTWQCMVKYLAKYPIINQTGYPVSPYEMSGPWLSYRVNQSTYISANLYNLKELRGPEVAEGNQHPGGHSRQASRPSTEHQGDFTRCT